MTTPCVSSMTLPPEVSQRPPTNSSEVSQKPCCTSEVSQKPTVTSSFASDGYLEFETIDEGDDDVIINTVIPPATPRSVMIVRDS